MDNMIKDVRYAIRTLIKSPVFSVTAILSLTLAIGASTTIFSFFNATILRAIPYKNPEQLVFLFETYRGSGIERRDLSYPDFIDWREQNQSFEQMAVYVPGPYNLGGGEPRRIPGELVSASYFSLLGVQAQMGRTFSPEEDEVPDRNPVAVISSALWRSDFASDTQVIGKTLKLNDRDYIIVGIMPESFRGLKGDTQVWLPMMMVSSTRPIAALSQRGLRWMEGVARLKPGVTIQRAQSDLDTVARRIEQTYPNSNSNRGGLVVGMREELFGAIRQVLLLLIGAVGFVLLIACANLANLLLVRGIKRQKELAIRMALGAQRRRLVRQLLTESVLLALIGGALGGLLSYLSVRLLTTYVPIGLPSFVEVNLDLKVLGFTLLTSVITGLLFGLIPTLRVSHPTLNEFLKEGGKGSTSSGHQHIRNVLVVAEIAITFVLLVEVGLVVESLRQLLKIDLGYNSKSLVTMQFELSERKYNDEKVTLLARQLTESVKNLSSIQAASISSDSPLHGNYSALNISIENDGSNESQAGEIRVFRHHVTPKFFSTTQIPLLKGRDFTEQDTAGTPPVVVVSDALARRFWPSEDPIGKRIKLGRIDREETWASVIGLVGNVKFRGLTESANTAPDIYIPLYQFPRRKLSLLMRSDSDPASWLMPLRQEVRKINSDIPVYELTTMEREVYDETSESRFNVLLHSIFAVSALLLAAIGIYGVISYSVTQRAREIGIRIALGAQVGSILWLIVGHGVKLAAIGLTTGLVIALSMSRLIAATLYGVASTNLLIYLFASLVLIVTTIVATMLPARRAVRLDPVITLRNE